LTRTYKPKRYTLQETSKFYTSTTVVNMTDNYPRFPCAYKFTDNCPGTTIMNGAACHDCMVSSQCSLRFSTSYHADRANSTGRR